MKIYVASSWRNPIQQDVVGHLREAGHEVYDFRNPGPGEKGFAWSEIDPEWQTWCVREFSQALKHPIAEHGFKRDLVAMLWADACVLVMPCGRSAHIEAGWFTGQGKPTIIYSPESIQAEPELMYKLANGVYGSMAEVLGSLHTVA